MSWIRPVFNSPLTARSKGAKIKWGKYFHVYSINEITSSLFQLYIETYFKKLANLLHNMVIPDYPTLTSTQYILTIGYTMMFNFPLWFIMVHVMARGNNKQRKTIVCNVMYVHICKFLKIFLMYWRSESSRDRILATISYIVSIKQYKTVDFLLLFFFNMCTFSFISFEIWYRSYNY